MSARRCLPFVLPLLCACTQTPDSSFDGGAQKGPYVIGSDIEVSTLSPNGNPTGKVYNFTTFNDRGEFDLEFGGPVSGFAAIEATGFYFNEVTGALADATLTLRSVVALGSGGGHTTYVNTLTHLAEKRTLALFDDGMDFDDARAQAESEVRAILGLIEPSAPGAAADMTELGGDTPDNAYLLAASCMLATTAEIEVALTESSAPAKLQEILNTIALDLEADGTVDLPRQNWIDTGRTAIDGPACMRHLQERLEELGDTTTVVPDVTTVLDMDGDGLSDAVDPDNDDDGILAADERLVDGATVWVAGFGDGSYSTSVLVVVDNIVDGAGGHAWARGIDTVSGMVRTAPFRIEKAAGEPLTGIVRVVNTEGMVPFFLLDDQGDLWRWTPGEYATPDPWAPEDIASIRTIENWVWLLTESGHYYRWTYEEGSNAWEARPDLDGLEHYSGYPGGAAAWVVDGTPWMRGGAADDGAPIPGTSGTIVETITRNDHGWIFLLSDNGKLYALDSTAITIAATEVSGLSGLTHLTSAFNSFFAGTDSRVWNLSYDPPREHTAAVPLWYGIGDIEVDNTDYTALLGVDGNVYLDPIVHGDPGMITIPK